jgi:hypothetical protein
MLENERNWVVRYDLYRARACAVRAEFERNRYVVSSDIIYCICSAAGSLPPFCSEEMFTIPVRSLRY